MKYIKTPDLWDPETRADFDSGKLKLQVGQWVRCGSPHLSRFVKVTEGGSIWAVHPEGILGIKTKKFSDRVKIWTQPRLTRTGGAE